MQNNIFIEVLTSPTCPFSPEALRVAKNVVAKLKDSVVLKEVNMATEEGQRRAMEYEIEATPVIAINGRVAYIGVPSPEKLLFLIQDTIERENALTNYFF